MNSLAPIVRRDVLMNVSLLFDIHFEGQIYVDDLVAVAEYEHDFLCHNAELKTTIPFWKRCVHVVIFGPCSCASIYV